jgi:hypothetical protein
MIQAVNRHFQLSDNRAASLQLDPAKEELLRQFIEDVGGIENARRAIEVLAELHRNLCPIANPCR